MMRLGLAVCVAGLILLISFGRAFAQAMPGDMSVTPDGQATGSEIRAGGFPRVEMTQDPSQGLPDELRSKIILWIGATAFLGMSAAFFAKQFDWQRLSETVTCSHCLAVHTSVGSFSMVCDTINVSALIYLSVLPFGAALNEGPITANRVMVTSVILAALFLSQSAIGTALQTIVRGSGNKVLSNPTFISRFLTGVRLTSFVLACLLLTKGTSSEATVSQFDWLIGAHLGERLLAATGIEPIRELSIVLAMTVICSFVVRWIVPLLARSRPLVFLSADSTPHHLPHVAHP